MSINTPQPYQKTYSVEKGASIQGTEQMGLNTNTPYRRNGKNK